MEGRWKFWNNKYFVLEDAQCVGNISPSSLCQVILGQCLWSSGSQVRSHLKRKQWIWLFAIHLLRFLWTQRQALMHSLKATSEDSESCLCWKNTGCLVTLTCMFSSSSFPFLVHMGNNRYEEGHSSPMPLLIDLKGSVHGLLPPCCSYQALMNMSEWDEERKNSCQVTGASKLPQAWCSVQHYQQCLIKENKNWKKHSELLQNNI